MLKVVLGLVVGVVAAFGTVYVLELLAHQIFPGVVVSGENAGPIPVGMQIFIILAYLVGAFVGGLVGGRIADRRWVAWTVALVVVASAVASIFVVRQPLLMSIAGIIAPLIGGFLAARMVPDRPVTTHDGGSARADV